MPVHRTTFERWGVQSYIGFHTNDTQQVTDVWCKTCARHIKLILRDSRIRGQAKVDAQRYVTGTTFVTKHSVVRHLSSQAHKIGLLLQFESECTPGPCSNSEINFIKQPRIDIAISRQADEAYKKLMTSAYLLAVDGQPLSTFKTIVRIQKANGVQLIEGIESATKCAEFVHTLSQAIRQKLSEILCSATAFSVLSDGSQARKTGSEKELILFRTSTNGNPVHYAVALQNIDTYGDATANNLKKSIDDVFLKKVPIPAEHYKNGLISATADGASVNLGVYSGLLTQMRNDGREWLLSIHCISHRVELAIKDALGKVTEFVNVKELMTTLYYVMKNSGKFQRHMKQTADALCVQSYKFPKIHGTRFVNHQRKGVTNLIHNWIPLMQAIENSIANKSHSNINAKLKGILKKLKNFQFLTAACLYKEVLDVLAVLSLLFEKEHMFVFDVAPTIEKTKSRIKDLLEEEREFPVDGAGISHSGSEIKSNLPKPGHMMRKEQNREFNEVAYEQMTDCDIVKASSAVKKLKSEILPALENCIDSRFSSFKDTSIYTNMMWLDPANWSNDYATPEELKSLELLAEQFKTPLQAHDYQHSKVKQEWKDFKLEVKHYYQNVGALVLWQKVFQYKRQMFPNLCLLAELVLAIGPSNSVVESGFSVLTAMLSDRRLSLNHQTMEDLLMIKINDSIWTDTQRNGIIDAAVQMYISKRRKQKIEQKTQCDSLLNEKRVHKVTETVTQKTTEAEAMIVSDDEVLHETSDRHTFIDSESDSDSDHDVGFGFIYTSSDTD